MLFTISLWCLFAAYMKIDYFSTKIALEDMDMSFVTEAVDTDFTFEVVVIVRYPHLY